MYEGILLARSSKESVYIVNINIPVEWSVDNGKHEFKNNTLQLTS